MSLVLPVKGKKWLCLNCPSCSMLWIHKVIRLCMLQAEIWNRVYYNLSYTSISRTWSSERVIVETCDFFLSLNPGPEEQAAEFVVSALKSKWLPATSQVILHSFLPWSSGRSELMLQNLSSYIQISGHRILWVCLFVCFCPKTLVELLWRSGIFTQASVNIFLHMPMFTPCLSL